MSSIRKGLSKAQLLNQNSKNDQLDDRERQITEQIPDYRFFYFSNQYISTFGVFSSKQVDDTVYRIDFRPSKLKPVIL